MIFRTPTLRAEDLRAIALIEEQRRQLVTETLARPGWKDGKRGPSGKKRLDDLFLAGTK